MLSAYSNDNNKFSKLQYQQPRLRGNFLITRQSQDQMAVMMMNVSFPICGFQKPKPFNFAIVQIRLMVAMLRMQI